MSKRKVKIAKTDEESEAKWAGQYFNQWQEVTKELAEYRTNFELKEQTIADLRAQIDKSYIAGMKEMQRLAVQRIESWVADTLAITNFDGHYNRAHYNQLVNAVVWATCPPGDDPEKQS